TKRTIEQIAEAIDATWQSNRSVVPSKPATTVRPKLIQLLPSSRSSARKKKPHIPQPSFIAPMLATPVEKLPDGSDWEYEVKWDGHRIEAVKHGDHVRLYSRKGKDQTSVFRTIAEAVSRINAETVVIDGEVVAID